MTTRLVVCFDGTWDTPATNPTDPQSVESNVVRFYESVPAGTAPDGVLQKKWYDTGVGTDWYDRIRGGAFGFGLDQKIQEGYQFLVENYPDPAPEAFEIFVLGFSRGAYTARSLVGLIRNVGLLTPDNIHRLDDAYALYRRRDASADAPEAQAFRQRYSRAVEIKFLGVWDTVGALGIPVSALQWLDSGEYAFHDTELSGIVKNAAHALAIDEHRVDYQATLWKRVLKEGQSVEQRWFIGAHADIGGGYESRLLSDITLQWMQQKAQAAGLAITPAEMPAVAAQNWAAPVSDSYHDFLGGVYALTHPPFDRPIDLSSADQTMDDKVMGRCRSDAAYRPKNPGFPPIAAA